MTMLHKFGQLLLGEIREKLLQSGVRFTIMWRDGRVKFHIKHFNELFLLKSNVNSTNFIDNYLEFG